MENTVKSTVTIEKLQTEIEILKQEKAELDCKRQRNPHIVYRLCS